MKTVLVTGHAGFIGSHLTEKLLFNGFRVIGLDNYNNYYDPKIKERNISNFLNHDSFKQYRLDILNVKDLENIFEKDKIDLIVHLAARAGVRPSIANPELYEKVNVQGTKNLLEIAQKYNVGQFIFGSSSSVYGEQEKIPFSEDDPTDKQVSPYAKTKKKAEELCRRYAEKYRIKITVLRFFTVYGPRGRPDMAPFIFTKKILARETITRFGDGSSSRDYTYIDDIASGIMAAINKPFNFEIINLGNNKPIKLNQFIALIEKLTGKKAKIIEKPRHPADVLTTYADIRKAKKLLAWQPKTNLETGMKQFIDWYTKQTTFKDTP